MSMPSGTKPATATENDANREQGGPVYAQDARGQVYSAYEALNGMPDDDPSPGTDIESIAADVECMVWGFDAPEHKAAVRALARRIRALAPASPPTPGDPEHAPQAYEPKVGDRVAAVVHGAVTHVRDTAVRIDRDDGTAIYADVSEVRPAHEQRPETHDAMVFSGDRVEGIAFVGRVLDEVSPDGDLVLVDVTEISPWMIFKGQRWVSRSNLRRITQPSTESEVGHG